MIIASEQAQQNSSWACFNTTTCSLTVNVRTQEAIEVLAVCLYHKEKLILESHTLFFKSLIPDSCFVLSGTHQWYP